MSLWRVRSWQTWSRLSRGLSLGVRAVVVDEAGRVLMIEHTYTPGWHIPGGGVERDETAEEAVIRELREETGIEVIGRPRLISVHDNRTNFRGDHVLVYRVDHWRAGEPTQKGEILDRRWFSPDALPPGTTNGTRRRINEVLAPTEPDPKW